MTNSVVRYFLPRKIVDHKHIASALSMKQDWDWKKGSDKK